jgi:hypothetical protein
MSSTFSAENDFTCTYCQGNIDMLMHYYEETREALVFGQKCKHCLEVSEELAEFIGGLIEATGPLTVHFAEHNTLWCMQCDTPTQVDFGSMHEHVLNVHPTMWAALN